MKTQRLLYGLTLLITAILLAGPAWALPPQKSGPRQIVGGDTTLHFFLYPDTIAITKDGVDTKVISYDSIDFPGGTIGDTGPSSGDTTEVRGRFAGVVECAAGEYLGKSGCTADASSTTGSDTEILGTDSSGGTTALFQELVADTNMEMGFSGDTVYIGSTASGGGGGSTSDTEILATDKGGASQFIQEIVADTDVAFTFSGDTGFLEATVTGSVSGGSKNQLAYWANKDDVAGDSEAFKDGSIIGFNTGNTPTLPFSETGLNMQSKGDTAVNVIYDANRSAVDKGVGLLRGRWNGNPIAQIGFQTADDAVNKDEGRINFSTWGSGGTRRTQFQIDAADTARADPLQIKADGDLGYRGEHRASGVEGVDFADNSGNGNFYKIEEDAGSDRLDFFRADKNTDALQLFGTATKIPGTLLTDTIQPFSANNSDTVTVKGNFNVNQTLSVDGTKNFVETRDGKRITYTSSESGEVVIEWTDTVVVKEPVEQLRLSHGNPKTQRRVELPEYFRLVMSEKDDYHVVATPQNSIADVGIYDKNERGFTIKTNARRVKVDFHVRAIRRGYDDKRIMTPIDPIP